MRRLLLGESEWLVGVATECTKRPGTTTVYADSPSFVETLREAGIDATTADPTDPTTLPAAGELVVAADTEPARTVELAELAADRYPAARLIAVTPEGTTPAQAARLETVADQTVDPTRAVVDRFLDVSHGEPADRTARLLATLRDAPEPLLVVPHDNPDPDAIAAAVTLVHLAERVGVACETGYYGNISHQENRALVNLLELSLIDLDEATIEEYGSVALVDHAVVGVNDSLPETVEPLLVIDHHPPTGPADAPFYDVRPEIGATATMFTEYLSRLGIEPTATIATALLYGIRVDTGDFTRNVTPADFEAVSQLVEYADTGVLDSVETPSIAAGVFETLAMAIDNREVRGHVAVSCVGEVADRDVLPQAADQLLAMDGIEVAVVYGYRSETVFASGRARGSSVNLGEMFREAFGGIGSAGGHADMAGAQLTLGVLAETAGDQRLEDVLREVISERFFEAIATPEQALVADDGQ